MKLITPALKNKIFSRPNLDKGRFRFGNSNLDIKFSGSGLLFSTSKNQSLEADRVEFRTGDYVFYFMVASAEPIQKLLFTDWSPHIPFLQIPSRDIAYIYEMYPGEERHTEKGAIRSANEISSLLDSWLRRVEDNQIDHFETFNEISVTLQGSIVQLPVTSEDERDFDETEISALYQKLESFEQEVRRKIQMSEAEIATLKKEMEFLRRQIKIQNKQDFKTTLRNALVTILANYASDPEKIISLISIIKKVFGISSGLLPG